MNFEQTQASNFLNRVFGPEFIVREAGWLSDLVDLQSAHLESSAESFFSNMRYSLAVTRRSDRSLVCLVYNTWDNIEESANSTCRSALEQFGDEHGVLVLYSRSDSWEPLERILSRRDMRLLLAQADGYPYDYFDGEADNEMLGALFGSANETPNVEGVPVPFESASNFDGELGRDVVGRLLRELQSHGGQQMLL